MSHIRIVNVPKPLMAEVEGWACLRRKSVEEAAKELLRVGVEVTSERAGRQNSEEHDASTSIGRAPQRCSCFCSCSAHQSAVGSTQVRHVAAEPLKSA